MADWSVSAGQDGVRLPLPLVVGLVLFVLTSAPTVVWMASNVSARLDVAEKKIERVDETYRSIPERLARMETKTDTIYVLMSDLKREFSKDAR